MDQKRFWRVERLFHAALAREPEARQAFLDLAFSRAPTCGARSNYFYRRRNKPGASYGGPIRRTEIARYFAEGWYRMRFSWVLLLATSALTALHAQNDWPTYGHDPGGQRYSPLKQINTTNVTKLVQVWSFRLKKEDQPFRLSQSIPLVVNGVLYVGWPYNHVAALEPETGKVLWEFTGRTTIRTTLGSMRSLGYWPAPRVRKPKSERITNAGTAL